MDVIIFDIIDNDKETSRSNWPLLWYLFDTTSSVYNNELKKKLTNNDNIYSPIRIIFILLFPNNIYIISNFWNKNILNMWNTDLWSKIIALE